MNVDVIVESSARDAGLTADAILLTSQLITCKLHTATCIANTTQIVSIIYVR